MLNHYLLTVNAAALLLMLADKWKAIQKDRRIPERVLLCTALLGGCFGAAAGMYLFRHKTRHLKFSIGLPVLCAIYTALWFFLNR